MRKTAPPPRPATRNHPEKLCGRVVPEKSRPRGAADTLPGPCSRLRCRPWPAWLHSDGSWRSSRTYRRWPPPPARDRSGPRAKASPSGDARFQRSPGSPRHTAPSVAAPCPGSTISAVTSAETDSVSQSCQRAGRAKVAPKTSQTRPRSVPPNAPHSAGRPRHPFD